MDLKSDNMLKNRDVQSELGGNKKKINIKLIIFIFVLFVLIFLVVLAVILVPNFFKDNSSGKILVYKNNDNELKYISNKNDAPILLSKSYEELINVKFSADKTKIVYVKNGGLYLNKVNSKKESIKIGVDVSKYEFINNEEVIYLDINENLYLSSSLDNKKRIDIDVSDILFKKKKTIVYSKGEEIYLYDAETDEKTSILKDYNVDKKLYFSDDLKKILYVSVNNELRLCDIESKDSVVKATEVYDIVDCSNDFSNIIYTTIGKKKKYYDLFVNDNPADNPVKKYQCTFYNFNPSNPTNESINAWGDSRKKSDTQNKVYYIYSYYGYMTYIDESGELFNATSELIRYCNGEDPDGVLKDRIRNDDSSLQLYNAYLLKDDKKIELATDISDDVSSSDKIFVYTKFNLSNDKKVKISSLSSVDDFKKIIDKMKPNLYYAIESKKDELLTNNFSNDYKGDVYVVDDKIYFSDVNDKDDLVLYEYNVSNSNKDIISKKGTIMNTNKNGYDILYLDNFNRETLKGDLVGRKNGKNTNIDIDVYTFLNSDKNNIYYYKDFNSKTRTGSYIINNLNKNKKEVIEDVSVVFNDVNNKYFVFKDYSSTSKTYSLFIYDNGKHKTIEYNVVDYRYSY